MKEHGIRLCSDWELHDYWHACLRRGLHCSAEAIQREMARRHLSCPFEKADAA